MWRLFVSINVCLAFFVSPGVRCDEKTESPILAHDQPPATHAPRKKALVLPAWTNRDSEVQSSVVDVLITGGLEDLGVYVVDRRGRSAKCPKRSQLLDEARLKYLDLEMADALELAENVRRQQFEAFGDLLGCPELTETELFMVQVLLDSDEGERAFSLALEVLRREPNIALDPARYTPGVLALWGEAAARVSGERAPAPNAERLSRLAARAEVEWVVLGACSKCGVDGEPLRIYAVRAGFPKNIYRGSVRLGPESQWALRVRETLGEPFPPPEAPAKTNLLTAEVAVKKETFVSTKKAWYKTWWFWTVVGAVVVGGTAGAVGGYYANTNDDTTRVKSKIDWK